MTIHYTDDHQVAPHRSFVQDGAEWRSWLRDILVGALVFVGLLAVGALPIALRVWFMMPN